jgi:hypothetical protein
VEILDSNAQGQCLLAFKSFVEALAKIGFYTHCLQNKHTHPDKSLFCWIVLLIQGIKQNQNCEIVSSLRVNDEGSESFIAL